MKSGVLKAALGCAAVLGLLAVAGSAQDHSESAGQKATSLKAQFAQMQQDGWGVSAYSLEGDGSFYSVMTRKGTGDARIVEVDKDRNMKVLSEGQLVHFQDPKTPRVYVMDNPSQRGGRVQDAGYIPMQQKESPAGTCLPSEQMVQFITKLAGMPMVSMAILSADRKKLTTVFTDGTQKWAAVDSEAGNTESCAVVFGKALTFNRSAPLPQLAPLPR